MTLEELRTFLKHKGFVTKVRINCIKIPNYRDYVLYLYKENKKNYCCAWDVCYGEHWANQENKVFERILNYIETTQS